MDEKYVLDTARHVASISVSNSPIPYYEMVNQCEALAIGKQKKMSILMSFKRNPDPLLITLPENNDLIRSSVHESSGGLEKVTNQSFSGQKAIINAGPVWYNISPTAPLLRHEEKQSYQSFRLPPSSPYDNFLKAAGC